MLELVIGGFEIFQLALVLPAEEVFFPHIRETVTAAALGDALLETEGFTRRIGKGERLSGSLFGRFAALIRTERLRCEVAEEIVQDAFVAVWRRAASFDPARGADAAVYCRMLKAALAAALSPYAADGEVALPGAVWLVTANA